MHNRIVVVSLLPILFFIISVMLSFNEISLNLQDASNVPFLISTAPYLITFFTCIFAVLKFDLHGIIEIIRISGHELLMSIMYVSLLLTPLLTKIANKKVWYVLAVPALQLTGWCTSLILMIHHFESRYTKSEMLEKIFYIGSYNLFGIAALTLFLILVFLIVQRRPD